MTTISFTPSRKREKRQKTRRENAPVWVKPILR